jgi:hypothetical protein
MNASVPRQQRTTSRLMLLILCIGVGIAVPKLAAMAIAHDWDAPSRYIVGAVTAGAVAVLMVLLLRQFLGRWFD